MSVSSGQASWQVLSPAPGPDAGSELQEPLLHSAAPPTLEATSLLPAADDFGTNSCFIGSDAQSVILEKTEHGSIGQVCPFRHLSMGHAQVQKYLSDMKHRSATGSAWKHDGKVKLDELIRDAPPEISVQIVELKTKFQDVIQGSVCEFRSDVFDMAETLVECVKYQKEGDESLYAECVTQFERAVGKIKADFCRLTDEQKRARASLCEGLKKHTGQREANTFRQAAFVFFRGLCLTSAAVVVIFLIASFMQSLQPGPESRVFMKSVCTYESENKHIRHNLDFSKRKCEAYGQVVDLEATQQATKAAAKQAAERAADQAAGSRLLGVIGLLFAISSRCVLASRREIQADNIHAQVNALQHGSVTINQEMWQGMYLGVTELERSVNLLRAMDKRRTDRVYRTMHDIANKLFGMSMAVDEYMAWLGQNGYFPANFSVRTYLGPDRYDAIVDAVESASPETFKLGRQENPLAEGGVPNH